MPSIELWLTGAGFVAWHAVSFAVLAGSAWVFGATCLGRLLGGRSEAGWPLAGALGLGVIVQAMFVLGLVGLLDRTVVLAALVLGHLLCRSTWHSAWHSAWRARRRTWAASRGAWVLAALAFGPTFWLALYPPTGFDATVYHLPYARAFIESGALPFLPELRFPVFPQAGEMGFVLGFFLSGEVAAKLTQLLAVVGTAGLLGSWGARYFSREVGGWAAALWLGSPLVVVLATSAYVDATLTLFVTSAFFSWQVWARTADRRWLRLAGIFSGLAASTKYLGLFFLAALVLWTLHHAERGHKLRRAVELSVIALVVLAPWYLRIVYYTGNPVFPFYAPIFGESEWATLHDENLALAARETAAGGWSVVTSQLTRIVDGLGFLLAVPWTAVFERELFHRQAPISPFYLLLLPLCGPFALFSAHTRRWLLLVAAYGLFWLTTVRDLRFLVAVAPVLNLALAAAAGRALGWRTTPGPSRKRLAGLVAAALIAPGWLYAGYKISERGSLPVTAGQREAYLARQVPGYQALLEIERAEGSRYAVYALYGENLRYYASGRFVGDWFGPASFRQLQPLLRDGRALYGELRDLGVCYLLIRRERPRAVLPRDEPARRHFELRASDESYALYRLRGVACSAP